MLNDKQYIEENKDSIMGVMRSVAVCLKILLDSKNQPELAGFFEQELFSNNDLQICSSTEQQNQEVIVGVRDPEIIRNNLIINNLSEILFNAHYGDFIQKFIDILYEHNLTENAGLFIERLEIARNLPEDTKNQARGIISSLQGGAKTFFDYFFSYLVNNEHPTTQSALMELFFHVFNISHHCTPDSETSDGCNYYDTQDVYDDEEYSYLWGNIHKNKETSEELELVNQRINFIQAFKSGVVDQKQDYIWKFKETENSSLEEINTLLKFSNDFPTNDFSERLSLTINQEDPMIEQFKLKLQKIKINLC